MMKFLSLLLLATSCFAGVTESDRALVEKGRNLLKNPGFENGISYWTSTLAAFDVVSSAKGFGALGASLDDSASSQSITSSAVAIPSGLYNSNGEASCYIAGPSNSAYKLQAIINGVTYEMPVVTESLSVFKKHVLNFPFPATGNAQLRLISTANGPIVYADDCYLGAATNIGTFNSPNTFSAKVSATGVVTDQSPSTFITSCSNANPFVCTFQTSFFTNTPNCTATLNDTNSNGNIQITASSSSSISISTAGNGTLSQKAFNISCSKTGSDTVQNAVSAQQSNYDWTAYTPTFVGFGTATSIDFKHKREGSDLLIRGRFTTGTNTAVIATVSLPTGLTSADSSKITVVQNAGVVAVNSSGASSFYALIEPSNTVFKFGVQNAGASSLTAQTGTNLPSGGAVISVDLRVPIQGWIQTNSAPLLVGSVTSNSLGAERIESALVTCSATASVSDTSSSWLSVANISGSRCALTFSPAFSSKPKCTATTVTTETATIRAANLNISSSTSGSIGAVVFSGGSPAAGSNEQFNLICTGPR